MFWYDGVHRGQPSRVDWTEDERSWFVLVGRITEGNEHALPEFYDVTNRIVYGLALRILGVFR